MNRIELYQWLAEALDGQPQPGIPGDERAPERDGTPAAVLVPLVLRDEPMVLLTRRTAHLRDHAGQISFPGGRMEAHDATPEETALRETEEEIGLQRSHVELVGRLPVYRTITGYHVTPVVGMVQAGFDLRPDTFEVAEVFEIPLAHFLDPSNHRRESYVRNGEVRHYWAMPYGDYYVWGATAGMLYNLYLLLKN